MYIYVFGRFSSSKNEKKMCEKQKEKKEKVQRKLIWVIAQTVSR